VGEVLAEEDGVPKNCGLCDVGVYYVWVGGEGVVALAG
jgi:hypothetical protein